MVSEKLVVTLLVVAILLSVFSLIVTYSIDLNSKIRNPTSIQGNNQGQVKVQVNPNPLAGPTGNSVGIE